MAINDEAMKTRIRNQRIPKKCDCPDWPFGVVEDVTDFCVVVVVLGVMTDCDPTFPPLGTVPLPPVPLPLPDPLLPVVVPLPVPPLPVPELPVPELPDPDDIVVAGGVWVVAGPG